MVLSSYNCHVKTSACERIALRDGWKRKVSSVGAIEFLWTNAGGHSQPENMRMYLFPRTPIRKYYKLCGFTQKKFIVS